MENSVQLFAVRYVGKKPTSLDNVAKSGKCWQGNGDVQYVTQAQVKILTCYPDQWALDVCQDQEAIDTPVIHEITDDAGGTVVIAEQDLTGPLEKMTVAELVAYAQVTYGKQLNPKQGRKALLDELMRITTEIVSCGN